MILYLLFKAFIFLLGLIANILNGIPGINTINNAVEPYIIAISDMITRGIDLVSFFVPIGLLKILIPLVITIEIIIENLDIIKFALKKVIGR